jgi:hypothetical protein
MIGLVWNTQRWTTLWGRKTFFEAKNGLLERSQYLRKGPTFLAFPLLPYGHCRFRSIPSSN